MGSYSRLQIKQLKNLKREFPTAHLRSKALAKWAIENNHSYEGAMAKVRTLKARRAYGPRVKKPIVDTSGSMNQAPVAHATSTPPVIHTSTAAPVSQNLLNGGELTVKIKSLIIVGDTMKILW